MAEKLDKDATEQKLTRSKMVNRILTEHYITHKQQTFEDIWRTRPISLYCPQYGWLEFERLLTECQSCQYRTEHHNTKCPMWYKRQGIYSRFRDPPEKIKHRR